MATCAPSLAPRGGELVSWYAHRGHPDLALNGRTGPVAGYAIIEAPSVLGLFPGGVEQLPTALLDAGLADAVRARHATRVTPPPFDPKRDPVTRLLNPTGLPDFAHKLADATG